MPDDSYSIYSTKYIVLNILHAVIPICQSIMQMSQLLDWGNIGTALVINFVFLGSSYTI